MPAQAQAQTVPRLELDFARITAVYATLAELQVDIDDDPLSYGPKRLNGKIAEARRALTRCENAYLEISQLLHQAKRAKLKEDTSLQLQMDHLFTNDSEIRAGPSLADRESLARVKLRPVVAECARLTEMVNDLESSLIVIRAKRSDLRDCGCRLKDQFRLCQEELGLGAHWGSKQPGVVPAKAGRQWATATDSASVEDLIADMDEEISMVADTMAVPSVASDQDLVSLMSSSDAVDLDAIMSPTTTVSPPMLVVAIKPDSKPILVESASHQDVDSFLDAAVPTAPLLVSPVGMSPQDMAAFLDSL